MSRVTSGELKLSCLKRNYIYNERKFHWISASLHSAILIEYPNKSAFKKSFLVMSGVAFSYHFKPLWYHVVHSWWHFKHYLQYLGAGCWVRRMPNLCLVSILCFENLSSGLNLAGWADNVGFPVGANFCRVYTLLPSSFR